MDVFSSLTAFNQTLVIVCIAALIAFGLYCICQMWQALDS